MSTYVLIQFLCVATFKEDILVDVV